MPSLKELKYMNKVSKLTYHNTAGITNSSKLVPPAETFKIRSLRDCEIRSQ